MPAICLRLPKLSKVCTGEPVARPSVSAVSVGGQCLRDLHDLPNPLCSRCFLSVLLFYEPSSGKTCVRASRWLAPLCRRSVSAVSVYATYATYTTYPTLCVLGVSSLSSYFMNLHPGRRVYGRAGGSPPPRPPIPCAVATTRCLVPSMSSVCPYATYATHATLCVLCVSSLS